MKWDIQEIHFIVTHQNGEGWMEGMNVHGILNSNIQAQCENLSSVP